MRLARRVELERVEVGQVVADLAVGVDQPGDGRLRPRGVQIDRRPAARRRRPGDRARSPRRRSARTRRPRPGPSASGRSTPRSGRGSTGSLPSSVPWVDDFQAGRSAGASRTGPVPMNPLDRRPGARRPPRAPMPVELSYAKKVRACQAAGAFLARFRASHPIYHTCANAVGLERIRLPRRRGRLFSARTGRILQSARHSAKNRQRLRIPTRPVHPEVSLMTRTTWTITEPRRKGLELLGW